MDFKTLVSQLETANANAFDRLEKADPEQNLELLFNNINGYLRLRQFLLSMAAEEAGSEMPDEDEDEMITKHLVAEAQEMNENAPFTEPSEEESPEVWADEEPVPAEEKKPEEPAPAEEKKPEEPAPAETPKYTMSEVRGALAAARKKGVNVADIVRSFGVSNFQQIEAEKYPEVMAKLAEEGAL